MRSAVYQTYPLLGRKPAQVYLYTPAYRAPRHFHRQPELNLVRRGVAVLGVGEAVVEARSGDVVCFAPGQDHVLLAGTADLELFTVGVDPDLLADRAPPGAGEAVIPIRTRLSETDAAALLPLAGALANRVAPPDEVMALWEPLRRARWLAATSGAPVHELTRRALAAIARNPELDRTSLAAVGRTCPSEIARYFRRDVGITFVDYRTRLRLMRFIERVDGGATNLLRAALEAGFGSYSQLHRVFRAVLGCGPREFFADERSRMEARLEPAPALSSS